MPRLVFTAHLANVGPRDEREVPGDTVRAALEAVFAEFPRLRNYVLDDQDRVRKHVVVFIDGARWTNDEVLDLRVSPASEIYVLQALSGG